MTEWIKYNKLDEVDPARRVRVTRVLVYEGPCDWVRTTLKAPKVQIVGEGLARFCKNPNFRTDASLTCILEKVEVLI